MITHRDVGLSSGQTSQQHYVTKGNRAHHVAEYVADHFKSKIEQDISQMMKNREVGLSTG